MLAGKDVERAACENAAALGVSYSLEIPAAAAGMCLVRLGASGGVEGVWLLHEGMAATLSPASCQVAKGAGLQADGVARVANAEGAWAINALAADAVAVQAGAPNGADAAAHRVDVSKGASAPLHAGDVICLAGSARYWFGTLQAPDGFAGGWCPERGCCL